MDKNTIIEKSKEKQNLIIPTDDCYNIISVGKLVNNHKGFDRLVRIHYQLQKCGINNRLYIVGDGVDKLKLEEMITDDSVVLTGFVDNPFKYVKNADLFVCSSHREGYSTAVTEALILGVPVISTEVSGAKELVNNGCGAVCANNEEALYNAIKQALTNKILLAEYKQKAEQRSKKISPEYYIEMFDDLMSNY